MLLSTADRHKVKMQSEAFEAKYEVDLWWCPGALYGAVLATSPLVLLPSTHQQVTTYHNNCIKNTFAQ